MLNHIYGPYQFSDCLEFLVTHKVHQRKFSGIPQLIAEEPIAEHSIYIQIDIASLGVVRAQRKTHCIRTALRDAGGEVTFLAGNRSVNFLFVQIRIIKLLVQILQRDSANHVHRINNVTERLGHFTAVCIAHHWMQKHLFERQLAEQLLTEEHHTGDPKENDVVAGFE